MAVAKLVAELLDTSCRQPLISSVVSSRALFSVAANDVLGIQAVGPGAISKPGRQGPLIRISALEAWDTKPPDCRNLTKSGGYAILGRVPKRRVAAWAASSIGRAADS